MTVAFHTKRRDTQRHRRFRSPPREGLNNSATFGENRSSVHLIKHEAQRGSSGEPVGAEAGSTW